MDMLDYGLATLLYEDRLREAERNRRFKHLTLDMDRQMPSESMGGLVQRVRQWLASHSARRTSNDMRRPRAV